MVDIAAIVILAAMLLASAWYAFLRLPPRSRPAPPSIAHEPPALTPDELDVIRLAGELWNSFMALPPVHPGDRPELCGHIHAIQNMVMARLAHRRHAEIFTIPEQLWRVERVHDTGLPK